MPAGAAVGVSGAGANRDGAVRLLEAKAADGRPWELAGRVEPLPGCAAGAPTGYRLSLVARPRVAGGEGENIRLTPSAVYASWGEAAAALERLAAAVRADLAGRAGDGRAPRRTHRP